MKRVALIPFAIALLAMFLPSAALAKGASEAEITGPGLDDPIVMKGGWNQLGKIAEAGGLYAAVFGRSPNPLLSSQPEVELGPRYTITYVMPGPFGEDKIVQEVYPYAMPTPVTYKAPGQWFFGDKRTRGGWYVASTSYVRDALVEAGLPRNAPSGGDGSPFPWTVVGALAALAGVLVLAASAAVLIRRRLQTA